ncbi:MAG: hypothetical protein IKA23_06385 [Akkermansia sp.]|nr:hypothetical protein [Akkermansia sp.]
MLPLRTVLFCLGACLLASCITQQPPQEPAEDIPHPGDMNKPRMGFESPAMPGMNPLLTGGAVDPNAQSYNVSTSEELEQIDNGAEGEVYFTDPDNPDAEIAGITAAFEARRNGNGWLDSYGRATRLAHRECRPLIIWFHDSVIAPKSALLGEELLDTPAFNEWCRDRVVRVKLDSGASIDDRTRDSARYSHTAINRLANRYGLKRRPALAVVSPRGKLVMGIDGYNDFTQQIEVLLKEGVVIAEKEMDEYREKLSAKGYRTWTAAVGNMTLFARLQRFDEQHQMVYLKEYGGKISRTKLRRFSSEDREYILKKQEEKAARKKQKKRRKAYSA